MKKRVLKSLETPDGNRCVDIFVRPDTSFGFEIYRRDSEDLSGWFPIGGYVDKRFTTEPLAFSAAEQAAPWLKQGS